MAKDDIAVSVKVESHLDEAKVDLARAFAQWANEVGGKMVNFTHRDRAARGTPVDTGRLRNSMAYAIGGSGAHTLEGGAAYADNKGENPGSYSGRMPKDREGTITVYVGTNVEYAEAVEEGKYSNKGGAHMLRNAVMDVKDYAQEFLQFVLEANKKY